MRLAECVCEPCIGCSPVISSAFLRFASLSHALILHLLLQHPPSRYAALVRQALEWQRKRELVVLAALFTPWRKLGRDGAACRGDKLSILFVRRERCRRQCIFSAVSGHRGSFPRRLFDGFELHSSLTHGRHPQWRRVIRIERKVCAFVNLSKARTVARIVVYWKRHVKYMTINRTAAIAQGLASGRRRLLTRICANWSTTAKVG